MLRNLLLAIFLIALALPAIAAQHVPAVASETAGSDCHGMPVDPDNQGTQDHDNDGMRLHGCIGCVAPQSPDFTVTPFALLPFVTRCGHEHPLSGTAHRPHIPPPRS